MDWESMLALGLLCAALTSFLMEKVSVDVTALSLIGLIFVISGFNLSDNWPSTKEVFSVFSNEAPLTIAAMFIISASLNRCHLIEQVTEALGKFCKYGYVKFTLVLFVVLFTF